MKKVVSVIAILKVVEYTYDRVKPKPKFELKY